MMQRKSGKLKRYEGARVAAYSRWLCRNIADHYPNGVLQFYGGEHVDVVVYNKACHLVQHWESLLLECAPTALELVYESGVRIYSDPPNWYEDFSDSDACDSAKTYPTSIGGRGEATGTGK